MSNFNIISPMIELHLVVPRMIIFYDDEHTRNLMLDSYPLFGYTRDVLCELSYGTSNNYYCFISRICVVQCNMDFCKETYIDGEIKCSQKYIKHPRTVTSSTLNGLPLFFPQTSSNSSDYQKSKETDVTQNEVCTVHNLI